jgi:hypothetical protein
MPKPADRTRVTRRILVGLVVITLVLVGVLYYWTIVRSPGSAKIVIKSDRRWHSDVIRRKEMEALLGSAQAAGILTNMYMECVSLRASGHAPPNYPNLQFCEDKLNYWLQIGAENSNLGSMLMKVDQLSSSSSCYDGYRASFWLTKVLSDQRASSFAWRKGVIERQLRNCKW